LPSATGLFRPSEGWLGDVLPIYAGGVFHLFYGFLNKNDSGGPDVLKGVDLAHVTTDDFVTFEEQPLALHHGGADDADLLIGPGSIVLDQGTYVVFYAGINPRRNRGGHVEQVVLRATSDDLISWRKDRTFVLEADPERYERNDWRDPAVFRDGDRWRMLICARTLTGPFDRRGAIGTAVSSDLVSWEVESPLLAPGTTFAPECPQVVDFGGERYLLYSTYSDRFATRYRLAGESLDDWSRPSEDELDSHDVYAMKAAGDDAHLYLFGWLSTRAGDRDSGHRQWGGDLVVHEVVQRANRTLGTRLPSSVQAQFEVHPTTFKPRTGTWALKADGASFSGKGFGWCSAGAVAGRSIFEVTVDLGASSEEFGIAVRASEDFRSAYLIRFEPSRRRVVFDRRPHRIDGPFDYQSDRAYVSADDHEIERPLAVESGSVRCQVMVDGPAIVAYIGDVALTTRGYDLDDGEFGVYAANGAVTFLKPMLRRPSHGD
jgi:beta-fructofuranosidase